RNLLVLSATALLILLEKIVMPGPALDHERLYVHRLSIAYVAFSDPISKSLEATNRQVCDP
ncbi:MAG: hypothetical protein ACKN81_13410, partial [Pirellulaceae bacterium]